MKPRHLLLAVTLAGAAALVLFDDTASRGDIAEAVVRPTPPSATAANRSAATPAVKSDAQAPGILALIPRENLIGGAAAERKGEGLFASQTWTPPPPPPAPAAPPPPPSAPALPFTYLGKKIEDSEWEVFLARGDQTLIVKAQAVIDNTYRVDAIKPPLITLTYLPLNQVQTLTIGAAE